MIRIPTTLPMAILCHCRQGGSEICKPDSRSLWEAMKRHEKQQHHGVSWYNEWISMVYNYIILYMHILYDHKIGRHIYLCNGFVDQIITWLQGFWGWHVQTYFQKSAWHDDGKWVQHGCLGVTILKHPYQVLGYINLIHTPLHLEYTILVVYCGWLHTLCLLAKFPIQ
jgi:hypothetical protein